MPIEFNCRICDAMIRVPDKAAGGKGKCPKCGVRITVPKKSQPKPVDKPIEPEFEFAMPGAAEETSPVNDPGPGRDPDEVVMLETAGFHPEDLIEPPKDEFSLDRPMTPSPSRPSTKRSKPRKRSATPLIIMVAAAVVILFGVACFVYPILTAEQVSGEVTAGTAKTLELPAVIVDKSEVKLPSEELDGLLKRLESSPIPLTSNSMQVELSGSAKGLRISVASTSQSQFYRVSFKGNDSLKKYLDSHLTKFEDQRRQQVEEAANAFFLEYQNVIAKKSTSDKITPFRDSLAIPALVRGLGYYLVAEHGRGMYRCIYEDRDGGLYFLLPQDVQSFKVMGRHGSNDRPLVPIDFLVKVEGDITPLQSSPEKTPPKSKASAASKPAKEQSESSDDAMPGEK